MAERLTIPRYSLPQEWNRKFFAIKELRPAIAKAVCFFLCQGWHPSSVEQKRIERVVIKMLGQKKVSLEEIAACYESVRPKIGIVGRENIPKEGTVIFVANHPKGKEGPLNNMWSYFETALVVFEERSKIAAVKRKPMVIMQGGLLWNFKLFRKSFEMVVPGSDYFYDLVGNSLNWPRVEIPRLDANKEILNNQKLPFSAVRHLYREGAWIIYLQGTFRNDNEFPEKATGFVSRLLETGRNIQMVPILINSTRALSLTFGEPTPIQEMPVFAQGVVDVRNWYRKSFKS